MSLPAVRAALGSMVTDEIRDLSARQLCRLIDCVREGPQTVRGVAARLGVGKSIVTRAADRLAADGLLVRAPDARDRRSVLLCATTPGRRLVESLAAAASAADYRGEGGMMSPPLAEQLHDAGLALAGMLAAGEFERTSADTRHELHALARALDHWAHALANQPERIA